MCLHLVPYILSLSPSLQSEWDLQVGMVLVASQHSCELMH